MSIDLAIRSLLRDVVREVVREELTPMSTRAADPEFLTYAQAAALVGVSAKTVKQWGYSGRLTTYGHGRIKRVKSEEVRACLAGGRRAPSEKVSVDDTVARLFAKGGRR